jgi:murein DD-endopeptidase MepM/ murein hydrolase activator NlpD
VLFINTSDKADEDPPELVDALASPAAGGNSTVQALIAALGCSPKSHVSLDFSPSSAAWQIGPPLCPAAEPAPEAAAPAPADPGPAVAEDVPPPPAATLLPLPPSPRPDAESVAEAPEKMPAVPPVPVAAAPLPEVGAPAFAAPVAGKIVADFGSTPGGKANKGIDYEVPAGSSVKAAEAGEVVYVGDLPGYGKVIAIKHGNEWATVYGHTSDVSVAKGQVIAKGQDIAHVDPAGNRLHFEIRRRGKPVDPRTMTASTSP